MVSPTDPILAPPALRRLSGRPCAQSLEELDRAQTDADPDDHPNDLNNVRCKARIGWLLCAATFAPLGAQASNGINLIGFGSESMGQAGADVAVARDPLAINTNPAGLSQIKNRRLDLYFATGFVKFRLQDTLNPANRYNTSVPLGSVGYAWRHSSLPLSFAAAVFAQGGAGADHEKLNTVFGTVDDLKGTFGVGKLGAGLAYDVTDKVSLGASLSATIATLDQDFFPNTSVFNAVDPTASFYGFQLRDAIGKGAGVKLGAQYRPSDRLTLGLAYTSPIDLDLEDGELVSNQRALGLGDVTYRDTRVEGLSLPQEIGIGVAYQATPKLRVVLELDWINWSAGFEASTLRASDPNNPAAQPIVLPGALNWDDQWVIVIAMAYACDNNTTLRAGFNYGRSPIPNETLTPFMPSFAEKHITFGFEHRLGTIWVLEGALEYDVRRTEEARNPRFPTANPTRLTGETIAVHVTLSRRW